MTVHYVYRCFDEDGRLLYVGQTRDVQARMVQHRQKFWASQVARLKVTTHRTPAIARDVEREAIRTENPRFNMQGRWAVRNTWEKRSYDDFLMVLTDGDLSSNSTFSRRNQIRALFADFRARYGEEHPLAMNIRSAIAEAERRHRAESDQRRAEHERRMQEFRKREAAEEAEHRRHCCSCDLGIAIDDDLILEYGDENAKAAVRADAGAIA